MALITVRKLAYKSYTGAEFTIPTPSNGAEPQTLTVKLFKGKSPRAEVSVGVGYFSESRGVGGVSAKAIVVTAPEVVAMCAAAVSSVDALAPMIDKLQDDDNRALVAKVARWWLLSQQDSITEFLAEERRANKPFGVGDTAVMHGRPVTIASERFDSWSQMWFYGVAGEGERSQYHYHPATA